MNNVTVTIDGKNITVPVDPDTGKGKLVIDNLTAGNHTVVVNAPGNGNYTPKSSEPQVITVPKATSDMEINITGGEPGENVTITVNVGPNATGNVVVTINGEEHVVKVDENGTATYVVPNAQPGDLNITTEYLGDDNYAPVKNTKNITVPKYNATVTVEEPVIDENNNVTITVKVDPANATGNITVSLANGTNITVPVENGTAVVNVGVLPVNGTMAYNVTYSGDKNFNGQTIVSEDNITVGKLNNFTADIEIIEGQYGENTTVIVTVPEGADGNITVDVDGTKYPVVKNETTGKYEAVIPPMPVGNHTVTVAITNSSIYEDKELTETYNVTANDKYDIKVNVTEGEFGNDTVIEVEVPAGMNNVTVTIDGKNITVPVDSDTGKCKLVIDNLTAGNHTVVVNAPGNGNYTPKSSEPQIITVPKATSDMEINITGGEPGENVTITVNVGPNATGNVVVTVNGEEHVVKVDENGTATYVVPTLSLVT